jgi:AmmeMemoRadiSam system protein A
MGNIVFAGLSPHPPIIVKEVGGKRIKEAVNTVKAVEKLSKRTAEKNPDVLVFITPHAAVFRDAVAINMKPQLSGSFADFGVPQVNFNKENCLQLAEKITNTALKNDIITVSIDDELAAMYKIETTIDHGTMVPLYFLEKEGINTPIVIISTAFLSFKKLYKFGMSIRDAIEKSDLNAAVIASGDLSHRLTFDAPAGYDEKGQEFDNKIKEYIEQKSFINILKLPANLIERAGECGLRPLIMLLGALDGYDIESDVFSYEGPFGVGYLAAGFEIGSKTGDSLLENSESFPVKIARKSLETYLKEGRYLDSPERIPDEFKKKAGAFVSLKKEGDLRGCIGTIQATQPSVIEEIIYNAVSAGLRDPRFNPVSGGELNDIEFSVDILEPSEPIKDFSELDTDKYGVIVRSGCRSGLLLPDLEGVDTPQKQVNIALNKAGISPDEKYKLERFEVKRYR